MRAYTWLVAAVAGLMVASWPVVDPTPGEASSAAAAAPQTRFELPFPCGQNWRGTTRTRHSPSELSVDWNRAGDAGLPVVASARGTVTIARTTDRGGYGLYVVLDHGNGERTRYAHLASVTVRLGQKVDQADLLGTVGNSGNSSGAHLHYEQIVDGKVVAPWFSGARYRFDTIATSANCVEVPLAADWYGYGKSRVTIFRRATKSQFLIHRPGRAPVIKTYGKINDEPVVGDWDGNRTANVGVFSPDTATFSMHLGKAGTKRIRFGSPGDKPIAGDWDGNKRWEIGVWSPSTGQFSLREADGSVTRFQLGDADDLPVTGDWDADGRTDVGVYDRDTATFTLRKVDAEGAIWSTQVEHGRPGALPVTGDWEADGRTDLGVWDQATAEFELRPGGPGPASGRRPARTVFGNNR